MNILKNYKYLLQNLDCANCAKKIEDAIASKEEYKDVIVNFSTLTLTFKTDKEEGVEEEIKSIVKSIEPDTTDISSIVDGLSNVLPSLSNKLFAKL